MAGNAMHDWQVERDRSIIEIAKHLIKGRIGFLIGAGMSIPAGGLPGSELAFQLLCKAFFTKYQDDGTDAQKKLGVEIRRISNFFPLEAIAQGVIQKLTFRDTELEEILKNTVFAGKKPEIQQPGHRDLADLIAKLRLETIYTTNWDTLIEDALGQKCATITEKSLRKLEDALNNDLPAVIHLHGTFDDDPLIKEKDVMDPERPLFQLFMAELMTKAFVFVGYSLSDPNIRALYAKSGQVLKRRNEKLMKKTYIIAPPKSDEERQVATAVWNARDDATYLPMTADEFFRAVHQEIVTHQLDELKTKLFSRLGITLSDLNSKIESIQKLFPMFNNEEQVVLYIDAATRGGKS
jgi:hypothetical protein